MNLAETFGWIGNILLIIAMWNVGNRRRWAFLISAVGELTWLVASAIMGSPSMVALCVIFTVIAIRNYFQWAPEGSSD